MVCCLISIQNLEEIAVSRWKSAPLHQSDLPVVFSCGRSRVWSCLVIWVPICLNLFCSRNTDMVHSVNYSVKVFLQTHFARNASGNVKMWRLDTVPIHVLLALMTLEFINMRKQVVQKCKKKKITKKENAFLSTFNFNIDTSLYNLRMRSGMLSKQAESVHG